MMKGRNKLKKEETVNFEETMKELEAIVQILEKGELNLDDSIKQFEKGMELSKNASKYLEEQERKITILIDDKKGNIKEENF